MTYAESIAENLRLLAFPPEAVSWLCDLWNVIQVLDDAYDGDAADKVDVQRATRSALFELQANPFYLRAPAMLHGAVALQVLKWEVCNQVEAQGNASAKTYMWRAGFYDLVLLVSHICGLSVGPEVLALYGETLEEYLGEFKCQTPS